MGKVKKTKASKAKKSSSKSGGVLKSAVSAGKSALGFGGSGSGRRSRKKSAVWYLRETARLKAKARYQRQRMKVF